MKFKKEDFYEAWCYLNEHDIFQDKYEISRFKECLYIDVVKVNPLTKEIDDNVKLNTLTQVWLECGKYDEECLWHDIFLDTGAETFEQAIINLANLVFKHYGGY